MHEGDDLLAHIRAYVRGRVPPAWEDLVVELVGRTVVLVMTTPAFYNHLTYVQELQRENAALRAALRPVQRPPMKKPTPRKTPARKAPPRKATAPVKKATKKASPSRVAAFKKGAAGR